jgi:CRISPR-associated exonuclease Cas4
METDDYLPIYSLAEWHYCPRSAFLSWFGAEREDRVTPAYQKMREVHAISNEPARRDKEHRKTETAVRLLHRGLRVTGRADAVEWDGEIPVPVEYKNCPDEPPRHVVAQVTLQALCLSDMHGVEIPHGFIFRSEERRRIQVEFTDATRAWVIAGVQAFRNGLSCGQEAFSRQRQAGCGGCIYRAHCWPEEWPYV